MDREARPAAPRLLARPRPDGHPRKLYEPFGSRDQAELFISLTRASSLPGALAYVRCASWGDRLGAKASAD